MSMTAHTLPSETDRGRVKPHPDGRAWELADFMDDVPLDPSLRWNDAGVVILKGFVPENMLAAYRQTWESSNGPLHRHPDQTVDAPRIGGWRETEGYMHHEPVMDLFTYKPIHDVVESLIGEPGAVHLGLTGLVSSTRDWHQDRVLLPAQTGDHYLACWLAIGPEPVHPDSGPFEFFDGSHEWFTGGLSKSRMGAAVDLTDPRWPAFTEDVLAPLIEAEAARRGVTATVYLPEPGDLLLWHGRTWHRGSMPKVPNMYRGAAIWHLSGVTHHEFPYHPRRWRDQGFYMPYPEAVSPLESM